MVLRLKRQCTDPGLNMKHETLVASISYAITLVSYP